MKKVFWSKCKMFRNLHSFHGAFFCSDTYLRVTSLSASYPLSARHFPICEALPYLRGTFLSARHFPICKATPICELPFICEALPYLGATPYLRATSLSASHPLSVSHFPIWEPPPICEPLPYLRATPYLWVTSLSGSTPSLHYLGEPQFWLLSSTDMTELDLSDVSRNLCSYHLGTFLGSRSELQ